MLASSGFPKGQSRAWFSPDGRWFAASGPDGQFAVWEWGTWKKLSTLRGHSDFVWDICFLPHTNRLISLGNDRTVRLWEFGQTSTGSALTNNLDHRWLATDAMQFSPNGNLVTLPMHASMTNSETLLWNLNERKAMAKLNGIAVGFSPDGQQLLVHTPARRLQVLNVESQKAGHEFALDSNTNAFPKPSPDGRFLAYRVGNWADRYFRLYNAAGKTVYSTEIWEGPWEFSPDNLLLALKNNGTTDDDVSTLLLKELSGPAERRVPDCDAACLAFSPLGRLLAAGTTSPGVNLVDIASGTVIAKLRGHQTMVTAVAFSPDGKTLASGAQDRTIRLYNVETRREVVSRGRSVSGFERRDEFGVLSGWTNAGVERSTRRDRARSVSFLVRSSGGRAASATTCVASACTRQHLGNGVQTGGIAGHSRPCKRKTVARRVIQGRFKNRVKGARTALSACVAGFWVNTART